MRLQSAAVSVARLLAVVSAALAALAAPAPGGGEEAALLEGPESYAGESYRWAGGAPIEVELALAPDVPHTLYLRWGAKGDVRAGLVRVDGHAAVVRHGGYDGFDEVAVDVPGEWLRGARTLVRIERLEGGGSPAPFVSAVRAARLEARADPAPGAVAVKVQAEDLEGPWAAQTNIDGYRGRGFRVSNAAGIAATTLGGVVALPRAGRYAVWARGYEGDGADRSFAVELGGTSFAPTHRGRTAGRFVWRRAGVAALGAGAHALVVRDAGTGFEAVDALLVTDDSAFDPDLADRLKARIFSIGSDEDPRARFAAEISEAAEAADRAAMRLLVDPEGRDRAAEELRARLRSALGLEPPPPRTPLNTVVLGRVERDGYAVERLTFESRAGFIVTANVYVPAGAGGAAERFPAMLCPVGHWAHAKAQPQVQARCIGLAKLGFVVLTYDPFGQGERNVAGNGHREYFATVLAGRNNMSYMVWDTVRALDCLLERDDVDPGRIGCTGASGGGLNTFYAAAIDERIAAACPVVYVSRLREFLETGIDHCPCSHVNGLAAFADEGTVLALMAPRPVLMIAASADPMFTPKGAREALAQALPAYRARGAGDRIAVLEFPGGHDYSRPMREALYGWARRHLQGKGDGAPFPEPPMTIEPVDSPALRCFPEGKTPAGSATVRSLSRGEAERLIALLPEPEQAVPAPLLRVLGWRTAGAAALEPLDSALLRLCRAVCGEIDLEPLRMRADPLGSFGCLRKAVAEARAIAVVPLLERGGAPDSGQAALAGRLAERGIETVFLDLTVAPRAAHKVITDALLGGRSLAVRRAEALVAAARALGAARGGRVPVVACAQGADAGLVVLLAQACERPFAGLLCRGLPDSLCAAFEGGFAPCSAVWRLLEAADISTLRALAGVPVALLPAEAAVESVAEAAGALAGMR